MDILDEEDIKDVVCVHFDALGLKLLKRTRRKETGIDLIFSNVISQQRWFIETKGATLVTEARLWHFEAGLGQLVHRMRLEPSVSPICF